MQNTNRKEIQKVGLSKPWSATYGKIYKEKETIQPSPVALSARKMRPAHVPQTGFPILTNSRKAGNYRRKKD